MAGVKVQLKRAKTARGRRVLARRQPQIEESGRKTVFLKGPRASSKLAAVLDDLYALSAPRGLKLQRRNQNIRPFEDSRAVEELLGRYDCGSAVVATTRKRGDALSWTRCFDGQMLDIIETRVDPETIMHIEEFHTTAIVRSGSPPLIVVLGEGWMNNDDLALFRNVLIDVLGATPASSMQSLPISAIDRVLVAVAIDTRHVILRHMAVVRRSDDSGSLMRLEERGPRLSLEITRVWRAAEPLQVSARAKPAAPRRNRNHERGPAKAVLGRVHMQRQPLEQLALRRPRALRRAPATEASHEQQQKNELIT